MFRLGDMLPENYKPGFVFVVVQKRINTRLLAAARKGNRYEYTNPPPGTVLDHSVTRFKYKDFFLVPQSVNQGKLHLEYFLKHFQFKFITYDQYDLETTNETN